MGLKKTKDILKKLNDKNILILVILVFVFGAMIGGASWFIASKFLPRDSILNISYTDDDNLNEFFSVYEKIVNDYYKEVDGDVLIEGAITGMLGALDDPYTTYMNEEEMTSFNERMSGNYEGIGAYIGVDASGAIIISQPFTDSPAEKAGLMAGDKILEIDSVSTEGMTTDVAVSLIKGEAGTDVVLKIERAKETKTISVTRDTIVLHSVSSKIFDDNIGYIYIEMFSENSYEEFEEALVDLEGKGIKSLIIDVRDDTGGYLNEVDEIISLFLKKGEIMYQLSDKDETYEVLSKTTDSRDYDIVVLTNGYSASASEILTAALSETYGAKLVGTTTFGKGLVQMPTYLTTGGMIKYSNQKWLTPDGNWIHGSGIKPDYEVELSDEYINNPSDATDNQLQKAIKLLNE